MRRLVTNHVPRDVTEAHELNSAERAQFDYLNWDAIDSGSDSASFVRYKGTLYDLGWFMRDTSEGWDGSYSDSAFTGLLIRLVDNGDRCVIARVLA